MSIQSTLLKKILVLGATGVGKSYILNRLLNKTIFRSGNDTQPITRFITTGDVAIQVESGNINLCAFDTPGKFKY